MSFSISGMQISSKLGTDFNSQYNVPDTGLTNNTTLSQNPLYALQRLVFNGAQTNNLQGYNKDDMLMENGLKSKFVNNGKSTFTVVG